MIVSLS